MELGGGRATEGRTRGAVPCQSRMAVTMATVEGRSRDATRTSLGEVPIRWINEVVDLRRLNLGGGINGQDERALG